MSRLIIIGGKLQGVEALYLAQKAKIETVLIDKNPLAIGSMLCERFICADLLKEPNTLIEILRKDDIVLPALENLKVLEKLDRLSSEFGFILAFDINAYRISSSKLLSDQLFRELNMPVPLYYPNCSPPYIIKPSNESGSLGVCYLKNEEALMEFLDNHSKENQWIIQEFLDGPSYSIEVIGKPGMYRTYEITRIHMDKDYDCKMVTAPCHLDEKESNSLKEMAIEIAEKIKLKGIMDLEVIYHNGTMKLLEIDARIPSQTPITVYEATGINMIEEIIDVFLKGSFGKMKKRKKYFAAYEQLLIDKDGVHQKGEHIIGDCRPLELFKDKFCSDQLISDYKQGGNSFKGIFINKSEREEDLLLKRKKVLQELKK